LRFRYLNFKYFKIKIQLAQATYIWVDVVEVVLVLLLNNFSSLKTLCKFKDKY